MDVKKIFFYLILLVSVLVTACVKDRTNLVLTEISPIKIDTAGIPASYVTYQLDTLRLSPKVTKEGFNSDHLKYEWTMNAFLGYKRVIGTQKALVGQVTEAPSSTSYTLILTVTDTTTNLKAFYSWGVSVLSRFSEGLIVADTRDGISADLSLIMAHDFNGSFLNDSNNTKIHRDLYSAVNSEKISGLVKGLSYFNYNNGKFITLLTDNSIVRVDPNSYKLTKKNTELFIIAPDVFKPDAIQGIQLINQHEYLINDGRVYGRFGGSGWIYPFLGDSKGYTARKVCGLQQPPANGGVIYDELNNRFMLLPTMTSSTAPISSFPAVDNSSPAPAFDPANVGNKTCLFMHEGYNKRVLSVLKTRDLPQYYAYQVIVGPINGKMGYAMHDLSNNPDIDLSKFYACSNGEEVLFYATDTKVYSSTLLVGGNTSPILRYTTGNGEKITGMQMHIRGGNMYLPSLTNPADPTQRRRLASANRLVVLSTYNETTKEGKIVTIPLEILGVGGLVTDPAYIKTYTGFGKITAFNFQGL